MVVVVVEGQVVEQTCNAKNRAEYRAAALSSEYKHKNQHERSCSKPESRKTQKKKKTKNHPE